MADLHTISEELRLGNDSQGLTRTFSFVQEGTGSKSREEVFLLITLPDKPRGGENLIRAIFQTLREICFLEQEQDSYKRFESALKEVNAVIAEFQETLPNKTIGQISAVIGFLTGKDLHLTQAGEAEAYLVRQRALTAISEGLLTDDSVVDVFINIASGTVEEGDKIIFASERLLRYATKNELIKIFSPQKEISLALEELDEVIVLEGAQTTGVLACDVQSEAKSKAQPPLSRSLQGSKFNKLASKLDRGLSWVREHLPEGTNLPDRRTLGFDKNYLILGFLVVAILILFSISWSLQGRSAGERLTEVQTALGSLQTNLDLAKTRRNIGDKTKAYELLLEAEQIANDLLKAGLAIEEVTVKIQEINLIQDELDNIKRYTNLTPLVKLAAANPQVALVGLTDFHGRKIAFDAHSIFDTALDRLVNSSEIEATSVLRTGKYFPDSDALIFLTADGKILEWRDAEPVLLDTADEAWKSAIDFDTYSSYLYLLDPTNNQVWKYKRQREGFGKAIAYNENANLTQAVSISIDGDIWILAKDEDNKMENDIIRIRKGQKKALIIKDLPDRVWQDPKKIFTNENLKFIYVLDQTERRILRFYKDPPEAGVENRELIYNTQYFFEELAEMKDFWVDAAEQKLFVVDGQNIYEVTI